MRLRVASALAVILLAAATTCLGQGLITPRRSRPAATTQPGTLPAALPVSMIKIKLSIDEQIATVRVEHLFRNETDELLEGTYYFPVPEGASLIEFSVWDGEQRRVGRIKEKEEARAAYSAAVSQGEDPAILEMTRRGWFQSHIYPIPPRAEKRVEITYSELLSAKDGIISFDYPLGRGYKKLKMPVGSVEIELDVRSRVGIKNVFSPTHPIDLSFEGDSHVSGKVTTTGGADAENFQLMYALSSEDVSASLLTHRKGGEDGYFLLMLSPKVDFDDRRISAKDVVFVLDISSSMSGDKIRQAKEALRFGLTQTLNENDRFNIIAFASHLMPMAQGMLQATRANIGRAVQFVDRLELGPATNINDALVAAMSMFQRVGRPQNLVFITDGQPTASVTNPDQIVANARGANRANARVFTFGVGVDVDRVLLERLAAENRGADSYIARQEELGATVSSFFSKVSRPVLSDLRLDFGPLQVDRFHPAQLPDMYTRSQIKVFGRYRNADELRDLTVTLTGQMNEQLNQFEFKDLTFPLVSTDKDFLPKLWATERVNALLSQIRLYGETPELKQEVLELAREFNLVTPYTSMYVPTTAEMMREEEAKSRSGEAEPVLSLRVVELPANLRAPGPGTGSGRGTGSAPVSRRPGPPGAVVDPSGAAVAGATVIIKDQKTGITRTVSTDASGNYSVAGLPPGAYTVEVDASGFGKTVMKDVAIVPGQATGAGVTLPVGAVSETVTITSVAPALNTTVSHTASSVEASKLRDLPSLDPVDALSRLGPGVAGAKLDDQTALSAGVGKDAEFRFWINGGRPRLNGQSLNDHDNRDIDGRPAISINNFDAIETLHLLTTRASGDVGMNDAASIELTSRSGSNDFHGSAFGYQLNRRLGALSPLERRSGLLRAPLFNNSIYGGTLGGPISRDRAFFFGSFQGETEDSRRFVDSTSSLLTPTERGLRELARAFVNSPTVADLVSRGPFARSIGAPGFVRTLSIPVGRVPIEFGQVTRMLPSYAEGYEGGGRFDLNVSNRDRVRAEYWYDGRESTRVVGRLAAGYLADAGARAQLAGVRWTRTLSPRSTNELSFGFNRARESLSPTVNGWNADGSISQARAVGVNLGFRMLQYGENPLLPARHRSTLFTIADALTHVSGRHTIRLGGSLARRLTAFEQLPGLSVNFSFESFEDFVLNRPAALAVAVGEQRSHFDQTHQHYYADDAWRARSNLTLTFGLSYENAGQPLNGLASRVLERESNSNNSLFDPAMPLELRTLAKVDRDNNNFAPRVGFAYTPRLRVAGLNLFGYDKTVIRGGASISYEQTAYRPLAEVATSTPNTLLAVLTTRAGRPISFPDLPSHEDLKSLFVTDAQAIARTELAAAFRTPFQTSWHLAASRELGAKLVIEAGYAGSRGVGLIRAVDASGISYAGPTRVYESQGRSTYHSLQGRVDVRMTDSLVGGVAYTLSKTIDDVPAGAAQLAGGVGDGAMLVGSGLQAFAQNRYDPRAEKALSDFDRRHSLVGHFVWSLPIKRAQTGLWGRLLAGWQSSGIVHMASGSPYTPLQFLGQSPEASAIFASIFSDRLGSLRPSTGNPSAPVDSVAFSNAANAVLRLFMNPDGTPLASATGFIIADRNGWREGRLQEARFIYNDYVVEQRARARGLPPDAFGRTYAAGRPFGDVGRNTLTGPGLANIDFALLKTTKLSEKVSLQFRAEAFNLFNHPNRTRPNGIVENAGGFGFGDLGEVDSLPRRVRIALKLIF